jgi:hypothetical protein
MSIPSDQICFDLRVLLTTTTASSIASVSSFKVFDADVALLGLRRNFADRYVFDHVGATGSLPRRTWRCSCHLQDRTPSGYPVGCVAAGAINRASGLVLWHIPDERTRTEKVAAARVLSFRVRRAGCSRGCGRGCTSGLRSYRPLATTQPSELKVNVLVKLHCSQANSHCSETGAVAAWQ